MDKEDIRFAVTSFLQMCVEYSDNSIQRKTHRLSDENSDKLKQEIEKWIAYKEFTEYAIKELKRGELEDWLENIVEEYK